MYKRNIDASSPTHCCSAKSIIITDSECVCNLRYAACTAHTSYYIVTCDLSGCTIFFHVIQNTTRFSGKKLLNIVLIFSATFISSIFILRNIVQDNITNVHKSSAKQTLFLSDLNKTGIFWIDY
jgi:hypothetical protein